MSYSSINLAMISLFPSLIDGDFLGLPIFLFLPVLSSYYTITPHFFGIYRKFCTGEPADKILDRGKGRDYVHRLIKHQGSQAKVEKQPRKHRLSRFFIPNSESMRYDFPFAFPS